MSRKKKIPSVSSIIERAKVYCTKQKERLTKPRFEVLRILASSSKALGAYEVLEELGKVLPTPKPPTAYRAIEFWLQHGFIHRIESLNAYVLCDANHRHAGSQFMVCDDCGSVIEAHICQLPDVLQEKSKDKNFTFTSWNIEIHGSCVDCHDLKDPKKPG